MKTCEQGIKSGSTVRLATNPKVNFGGSRFDDTLWYAFCHIKEWLSVNSTNALMNAACTNNNGLYTISLTYYITDVYDWDKNNDSEILFTRPSELYNLKLVGAALDFEVRGSYSFNFTWFKGERLEKGLKLVGNMIEKSHFN